MKMQRLPLALSVIALSAGSALAADLPARIYTKAPPPSAAPNWTGFYVFGGGGGGIWNSDSHLVGEPGSAPSTRDQRLAGDGAFGTVGAGYDWQFANSWVAGVFADGTFGALSGSLGSGVVEGTEKLRNAWAAGARLGYLVAPNVLSYVNAGYTGSEWSGASFSIVGDPTRTAIFNTPSFHRDGWFVGGGVENSLDIFGITAPGLFMKTEYRAAYYDRITLPETLVNGGPTGTNVTFKPWVQTVSTSLVYRFNSDSPTALAPDRQGRGYYTKATPPVVGPNWTGFYVFGGGGDGIWDASSNLVGDPGNNSPTRDKHLGGNGWFGTAGAGYDWQFARSWVTGVFADGMFGALKGSLSGDIVEGTEKLRTTWAAGARIGYLVAPNVLSYVNAGYTGSEWSGTSLSIIGDQTRTAKFTTPSFHSDGWFVGGGVENSLKIFGITAPGLFMKTEYRAAYFDRATLPESSVDGGLVGTNVTFKPWVQTISTALVYRFNPDSLAATKY
jgi:outer membrane immunogenic protein